ncbi:kinase-like domain-containing protein [Gigaspora rosea]|uniref:Kinase-like domain-containing protein n=1 Tax=Gigaspora rosea TaxID=44941 RepID=A0A397UX74_9GLOM|nr:kinase-like domain-containing protein [Gigaspora rosea]
MVLQYANNGTLREYLWAKQNNGSYKISWIELIQIAKEIANGLNHLHLNGIIHQGLHPKNILINDGQVMISDFSMNKQFDDIFIFTSSNTQEMVAYIDPQCLLNEKRFKPNRKSDVYSLGVLFWELTSGVSPFYKLSFVDKMLRIANHNIEKTVTNTPQGYVNLYKRCWSFEPDQRPTLDEISIVLEKLADVTFEFIIN